MHAFPDSQDVGTLMFDGALFVNIILRVRKSVSLAIGPRSPYL